MRQRKRKKFAATLSKVQKDKTGKRTEFKQLKRGREKRLKKRGKATGGAENGHIFLFIRHHSIASRSDPSLKYFCFFFLV